MQRRCNMNDERADPPQQHGAAQQHNRAGMRQQSNTTHAAQ